MGCYTFAQLEDYARQAGFPEPVVPVMAAIAKAESGGCDIIQQGEPYGTTGWGLWQITPGNSESNIGVDFSLLDPLANAKAAYAKFKSGGLFPWTTWTSGAFASFLPGGSSYEPGARTYTGYGTPPPGSRLPPGNQPIPNPGDVLPGAAGAAGSAAGAVTSGVLRIVGSPLSALGSSISSGVQDIGKHLLPWLVIIGIGFFALAMFARELSKSGVAVPTPSGGGKSGGSMPIAEEAAAA